MRVVVTGGAGFVGKELVRTLQPTAEVLVADRLRYGMPDWLASPPDGVRLSQVDIRDAAAIRGVIDEFRPDAVVHLAAIHYIPECDADPPLAVSTNVAGTVNVLAACPPGTRVVFASSGAVYEPDEAPHQEMVSSLKPADIYGITKLQGEAYVRAFAADHGLSCGIVRLFNVIGPGETNPICYRRSSPSCGTGRRRSTWATPGPSGTTSTCATPRPVSPRSHLARTRPAWRARR